MSGASLRVQGDKQVFKLLNKVADPAARQQLMSDIGAYGVSSTQQRFLDQQGPDGVKWQPSRRAEASGGQTLRKSARLFASFAYSATIAAVAWGTNVVYAGIHHFGGIIRPKNGEYLTFRGMNGGYSRVKQVTMPARPYLGISAFDGQRIEQLTGQWVEGLKQ